MVVTGEEVAKTQIPNNNHPNNDTLNPPHTPGVMCSTLIGPVLEQNKPHTFPERVNTVPSREGKDCVLRQMYLFKKFQRIC